LAQNLLVVEDEPNKNLPVNSLISPGYSVPPLGRHGTSRIIAKRFGNSINVVLTDIVMSKMRGPALAKRLNLFFPTSRSSLWTGTSNNQHPADDFLQDAFFLQKPFSRILVGQVERIPERFPAPRAPSQLQTQTQLPSRIPPRLAIPPAFVGRADRLP